MLDSNKIEIVIFEKFPNLFSIVASNSSLKKYRFTFFSDSRIMLNYLLSSQNNPQLVIFDYQNSSPEGVDIIEKTKEVGVKFSYIVISKENSASNAVKAIQAGASDYLVMNQDLEIELPNIIEKALEKINKISLNSDNTFCKDKIRLDKVLNVRLQISIYAINHSLNELIQKILDLAEELTESSIGFFHFLGKDQKNLTLQTWSSNTLRNMCTAKGQGLHYPIEQAGVWVDCVRLRKPIIHNDYNDLPHRKGLPEGHAKVVRELVLPIFEGDSIVAILGVGNKETDYNGTDIDTLNQLSYFAWDIVKSKRTEEALQESEERYRYIFENNPQPIFIYDLETLAILQVNNAMVKHFGYSKDEFLSMTLKDLHIEEDMENLMLDIEKTRRTNNPTGIWRNKKKNGEVIYTEIVAHTVIFNNRTARHILINDITKRKITEDALIESESRYRSLFDNVTIGLYRTTPDGRILMANPTLIRMLGYNSFEELAQRNLEVEGYEPSYSRNQFRQILDQNGEIKGHESAWIRTDGSILYIRESAKAIHSENGNVLFYEGTIEDITERKQAEEKLVDAANQWKITFDTVQDGICLLDSNQNIVRFNKVMSELFPNCGDDMIGKPCWEVIHGTSYPLHDCPINKMKMTLQRESVEMKLDDRWFDITVDPIFDDYNCFTGAVHIVRNITERKKAEESLIRLNNQLEALNNTKDKLFTIIAHDLKSPFNSILGFSELLVKNRNSYSSEKTGEFIEQINSAAKTTLALIDNLLVWTKTQTGQIENKPEKLDLLTIVEDIIKLLSSTALIKNISIRYFQSDEIVVYADKNMLEVIIRNLISNAIKFTNINGNINVYAILDNNQVEVTVSDNGIGMCEEIRINLFKNNSSITTNGTANEKGSGLGLILCKEFVEKSGGRIWVESELGKGSEFKFTLPKG